MPGPGRFWGPNSACCLVLFLVSPFWSFRDPFFAGPGRFWVPNFVSCLVLFLFSPFWSFRGPFFAGPGRFWVPNFVYCLVLFLVSPFWSFRARFLPGPADFGSLTLSLVLSSSLSLPFGLWDPFFAGPGRFWVPNFVSCLVLFLVSPFWSLGPVFCRARQILGP